MNYEGELHLLKETFQKCRVRVEFINSGDSVDKILDEKSRLLFGVNSFSVERFFEKVRNQTVYRLKTAFHFCYLFMRLPRQLQPTLLLIGPYLDVPLSRQQMLEIAEQHRIPPQRLKLLEHYYSSIPHLPESSHLFVLLDTFGERIWSSSAVSLVDIDERFLSKAELPPKVHQSATEDILLNMKLMEERYAAENELIRAVSRGQIQKITTLMESFSIMSFERRLDDPLRNLKNYSIIMNTLLRKAAEQGGVHPYYLNEMSSSFALRLEQVPSVAAGQELMKEMYRSYCLLVRKHAMKDYSTPVQKAILMIEADLSADLSLSTLAAAQNISASYLSTVFKRETGKTVTDYINTERMHLAAHLLKTTRLQVQTVALHCGILDVQYFSKLFKKYAGQPPKEYRDQKND